MITYQAELQLGIQEFKDILETSTLAERRPIGEPDRLAKMLEHSNLIITARDNGKLIGVARSLTDFVFCTYLSDLAVADNYQKQGVGKALIRHTKLAAPRAKLILLAAPNAVNYYPKIGMTRHEHCFILDAIDDLR